MHRDRDFDLQRESPANEGALLQDLELDTLFTAMAQDDDFVFQVVKKAILTAAGNDVEAITYRQQILADCLQHDAIIRDLYAISVEAIEWEKKDYYGHYMRQSASLTLHRSVKVIQAFMIALKALRTIAGNHDTGFQSPGFQTFFTMLRRELSDEYFAEVARHLDQLKFRDGVLISAELGKGNKGANYVLRVPLEDQRSWWTRLFHQSSEGYTLHIHPRDEQGPQALSLVRDHGVRLAASALAQSTDHILSFFKMLRTELAFYMGGLNLREKLAQIGEPICFPRLAEPGQCLFSCKGLYDVCLALSMNKIVVGNDINADKKQVVIITGANQGGKTTFLRSVGLAQLLMQSGLFAPADALHANVVDGVFTHYKREEDVSMQSGKLDEELRRMSGIVDNLTPHAMALFNKSFAATNEREGSEIAKQIVCALLESGIKIFFVTHLYEFARLLHEMPMESAIFLRAERKDDRVRTFKLFEGEPLQTSFGEDLYNKIFTAESLNSDPRCTARPY